MRTIRNWLIRFSNWGEAMSLQPVISGGTPVRAGAVRGAAPHTVASMRKGSSARIQHVADDADEHTMVKRLLELGFVPGETVRIVGRSFPGGHNVAVRLGNTTFALRRHEASLIHVAPAASA